MNDDTPEGVTNRPQQTRMLKESNAFYRQRAKSVAPAYVAGAIALLLAGAIAGGWFVLSVVSRSAW